MKLHEFEPGIWIAPDLVAGLKARALSNGMHWVGYAIDAQLCGGGSHEVFRYVYEWNTGMEHPEVHGPDEWVKFAQPMIGQVAARIDALRDGTVQIVRSS